MATIDDLTISISEIIDDTLFEKIRDIRRRRRTPVKKKSKSKKTSKISTDSLISKISPTEKDDLIKLLEELLC